jgi:transposase
VPTLVLDECGNFYETLGMFLRAKNRFKDGKLHRYWSIVENQRVRGGRVIQRQVLYLGEINDSQKEAWCKSIEVLDQSKSRARQIAIFPDDRCAPEVEWEVVQVRLSELSVQRARQWGACWLACEIWSWLELDTFWASRLPASRKGTDWLNVLKTLVCYRLIDPGSEWRLHRQWYERSAMGDLLGEDAALAQVDTLYRCHDKLLAHKQEMFSYLRTRWAELFDESFEILLYDLTSTYFECDVPDSDTDKRKFGHSRDKRSDCVQVVIALIVTPRGLPIAYEVMAGNTQDKTTLWDFIQKIEKQYGNVSRTWIMDRGIPTEETLQKMRAANPPISYLVGTPKGRLSVLEKKFLTLPWEKARESVQVKLIKHEDDLYILARSEGRVDKERAMRKRRLKKLIKRLRELQTQDLKRDDLLLKLGAAKKEAGRAYYLLDIHLPAETEAVTAQTFYFNLKKDKLRITRRHEGHYLLRSNLASEAPAKLWELYIQLTEIEQAFKELKNDLEIRPVHHQRVDRIDAHIFIAFIAYCMQITLRQRLRELAPGLTARAVLEKFAGIQMVDVHIPTTDGHHLILSRYTNPDADQQLLLARLKMTLPQQPPPRIAVPATVPTATQV